MVMTLVFTMNTRSVQLMILASSGLKSFGIDGANTDPGMRIGEQYEGVMPNLQPGSAKSSPGSVLLWKPTDLTNPRIDLVCEIVHCSCFGKIR